MRLVLDIPAEGIEKGIEKIYSNLCLRIPFDK